MAIARAIVKRSIVYLLDEPFSNIDKTLSSQLTVELKQIFQRLNATVIFVSHDISEALTMADKVYVMHEGDFIYQGSPDQLLKSKDERIVRLLKQ